MAEREEVLAFADRFVTEFALAVPSVTPERLERFFDQLSHYEMEMLVEAGLTPMQALQAATSCRSFPNRLAPMPLPGIPNTRFARAR